MQSPTPPQAQDAYSPLVYDIKYQQIADTETQRGSPLIQIPAYDMLQSLFIQRDTSGSWIGTLVLFDRTDKILCGSSAPMPTSKFTIKWAWDNVKDSINKTVPYVGNVSYIEPTFQVQGTTLTIHLWGTFASQNASDPNSGPKSFNNIKWSDVIRQIAAAQKWNITAIEDTQNFCDAVPVGNQSYEDFIKRMCCTHATNGLTVEQYLFYFDSNNPEGGGGLHFHTGSYLARKGLKNTTGQPRFAGFKTARDYVYYADGVGEVEDFSPTDNSYFQVVFRAAGDTTYDSVSRYDGDHIQQKTTQKAGATDITTGVAGAPPTTSDARNTTLIANPQNRPTNKIGFIGRSKEELNAGKICYTDWCRMLAYTADLKVKGTHAVNPQDYVGVRYYTQLGVPHFLSGDFRVLQMIHTIDGSGWKTKMNLLRNARAAPANDPTAVQIQAPVLPITPAVPLPSGQYGSFNAQGRYVPGPNG